jgi:hypothetical protein
MHGRLDLGDCFKINPESGSHQAKLWQIRALNRFDEATNSLDYETERVVPLRGSLHVCDSGRRMRVVRAPHRAHRQSDVRRCPWLVQEARNSNACAAAMDRHGPPRDGKLFHNDYP